jgi:hypothetical protein
MDICKDDCGRLISYPLEVPFCCLSTILMSKCLEQAQWQHNQPSLAGGGGGEVTDEFRIQLNQLMQPSTVAFKELYNIPGQVCIPLIDQFYINSRN